MKNIYLSFLFVTLLTLGYSACPQNCTNCPTPTSCTACSAGFFVVNQTSCQPCPNGCSNCLLGNDGRPNCTACAAPAQLGANGQCFLCNPSCLTCAFGPNNCTSCKDGQQLQTVNSTGTCGAIANCPVQNCGQCAPLDAQNNTFCTRCIPGYFSFKRQCYPCLFSCAACNFNGSDHWPNVTQFFDRAIRETFNITANTTPPSGLLPEFMQGLDWLNMTEQTQRNWFEAFFISRVVEPLVVNLTIPQIVRMATQFVNSILNMSIVDQQRAILGRVNNITAKNFTLQQLDQKEAQIAANMTLCANCSTGFQMTLTPSGVCTNCAPHCVNCSTGSCTSCQRGYFVNVGSCSPCTAPCLTCQGSATTCTSCAPPASLTASGTCAVCSEPCATCTSASLSVCVTCKLPYSQTPGAGGVCYRCDQDLCVNCNSTNTSICYTCKNGSTLVNGRCEVCPVNCLSCSPGNITSPSICFQCIKGFILSDTNGTCVPCGPGCVQCSDSNTCLECQAGLFLNSTSSRCQKCRQGCTACTDSQSCSGYQPGVILINNQTVNCRPGCKVCDPTQPEVCTECQPRYFLDSGICKSCESGCQKCSSATVCTQCVDNLILQADSCLKCQGNCRTCNAANLTLCLTCIRGTTLVGGQCVRACSVGCVDCDPTNSTICLKCDQGHALSPNAQCVKCLGSCSGSCDARNISICLSCVDGFQLKENKCIRCSPGCAKCLNGQCSQCVPEFTLTQNSTGSYVCQQKCRAPCATCNQDQCLACEVGFIMNGTRCDPDLSCNPNCDFCPRGTEKAVNGSCVPCPANCSACTSGVCFQCVDGLFLDPATSNCAPCPPPCRTCFNNDSCDLCAPGFTKQIVSMSSGIDDAVYSDKCIPCDSNCRTCIVQPDRCTSCFDGFRLFSFRCAGLFTVAYSYELNISYSTFIDNSQSQNFIQVLSNITGINSTDNYVDYVREGSTVVGGTISASSQSSASTIQSSLGSSVSGYTVLSSSATVNYADSPYTAPEQTKTTTSSTNIGLIVGVVVGGIVLIGIIAFIIYKVKASKASQVKTGQQGTEFQIVNSVDNINHSAQFNAKAIEA